MNDSGTNPGLIRSGHTCTDIYNVCIYEHIHMHIYFTYIYTHTIYMYIYSKTIKTKIEETKYLFSATSRKMFVVTFYAI